MQASVGIVIPVFNEQSRLDFSYFGSFHDLELVSFLFVDDGSTDSTGKIVDELVKGKENFSSIHLSGNHGKANAIRAGWVHLSDVDDFTFLGFLDADGAFSFADIEKLIVMCTAEIEHLFLDTQTSHGVAPQAYWSSRINLSGRVIDRSRHRYILGRILANTIKIFFRGLPWDTQSGFKLFRNDDAFRASIQSPFSCKWLFDVELFLRLKNFSESEYIVWEEPLSTWHDVSGSKVTRRQYLTIVGDFLKLIGSNKLRKVNNGKNQ